MNQILKILFPIYYMFVNINRETDFSPDFSDFDDF